MYGAWMAKGSYVAVPHHSRYNFGTGDFTVAAMVQTSGMGTILSCNGDYQDFGNGGIFLFLTYDRKIWFTTYDNSGFYGIYSDPVTVFDGVCHYIAGVRRNGQLAIFVDGIQLPSSIDSNSSSQSPRNVSNNSPLTIGNTTKPIATPSPEFPTLALTGLIMNVGIWSEALTSTDLNLAMFNRPTSRDVNLCGFWTLNHKLLDRSQYHNTAQFTGLPLWKNCHHCLWTTGSHQYVFCQMSSDGLAANPIPCMQTVTVEQGTRVIYCSIVDTAGKGQFPQGVQVTLTDPQGKVYHQDTNTDSLFVKTTGNSLWLMSMTDPPAGSWKITVSSAQNTPFRLQFQSVPTSDPVNTSLNTLQPLFGSSSPATTIVRSMGLWDTVKNVAIAGIVGLVVGVVASPAAGVMAAIAIFSGLQLTEAQSAIEAIQPDMDQASRQIGGMLGYTTATKGIVIIDPNAPLDIGTQTTYTRRLKKLYPYVNASSYVQQQNKLIGPDAIREKVRVVLLKADVGYVSASGHGKSTYLLGWSATTTLPEILTKGKYDPTEASGKIFHFLACNTGYTEANFDGLGADLVAHGAKAFFGYKDVYTIVLRSQNEFCDCDIAIDTALIDGKTAEEAHKAAIALFNEKIQRFRADGDLTSASTLERNRDLLVSPVTDARFGDKSARIEPNP